MKEIILGISAYYHDSAAALVCNGEILGAVQEERFTRVKNDSVFPANSIKSILKSTGIDAGEITAVAFYEKPYIKFERLLETYHSFAPKGLTSYLSAMPVWIKEKLFMKKTLYKELSALGISKDTPLLFPEHHLSHAASAFFPSPYKESAILTLDGVGEWATSTIAHGIANSIEVKKELEFPHSIGLLYSAFTYYCGFKVNDGEYKLMGLAPYGNPNDPLTKSFIDKITSNLVDIRPDGSILLNMNYFDYATKLTMTNDKRWNILFGIPRREPESALTIEYANLAFAIQKVTETIILRLAETAKNITNSKNLVLAGGVSLNSVANGLIKKSGIFENIWIQPAAGDAGGALGAALAVHYIYYEKDRTADNKNDKMQASLLGPCFQNFEIKQMLDKFGVVYHFIESQDDLYDKATDVIADGDVLGWFNGKMEYGPRALGSRSIIADARNPEMQYKLNMKIKYREGFRPFAPAVLEEESANYFDLDVPSPYMLLVVPLNESLRYPQPDYTDFADLNARLNFLRSEIPSVTHLDYSARIQTVNKNDNPNFYGLIKKFHEKTGCPIVINTSFNVRSEPIVCTPLDAYKCFMKTEMDCLVLENYIIYKSEQKIMTDELFTKIMRYENN
jgi:carbamoyltransferase